MSQGGRTPEHPRRLVGLGQMKQSGWPGKWWRTTEWLGYQRHFIPSEDQHVPVWVFQSLLLSRQWRNAGCNCAAAVGCWVAVHTHLLPAAAATLAPARERGIRSYQNIDRPPRREEDSALLKLRGCLREFKWSLWDPVWPRLLLLSPLFWKMGKLKSLLHHLGLPQFPESGLRGSTLDCKLSHLPCRSISLHRGKMTNNFLWTGSLFPAPRSPQTTPFELLSEPHKGG